jgi:hypothetical protein
MTELVIRYCHGVRQISLDHSTTRTMKDGHLAHDGVLHDRSRERRIPLPPEMEGLPLKKVMEAMKGLFEDVDQAEARAGGLQESVERPGGHE